MSACKGSRDYAAPGTSPLDVNGSMNPDTIVIHAGRPARLRFMSLSLVNPNATVTLTARLAMQCHKTDE